MIRKFSIAAAFATALICAASVQAQGYPARPVKMLVGFVPGGTSDLVARLTAQELSKQMGQQFFVDNKGGASGTIAVDMAAKSTPDGYTLLQVPNVHALVRSMLPRLPYEDKDLAPIALTALTHYVLVVHRDIPATDMKSLLEYLRRNPGTHYASAGVGTYQHLAGEMFKRMAKVEMSHVPYKGTGGIWPDILAGRVSIMFENLAVTMPHIRSGVLRPIAVTSLARSSLLPEIPTVSEAGLSGFEAIGWFGLYAPAGTSPEIIRSVNSEVNKMLARPDFIKKLADLGGEPMGGTPEQLFKFHQSEQEKWGKLIRDAGIKME